MSALADRLAPDDGRPAGAIVPVAEADAERFLDALEPPARVMARAAGFRGREDQAVVLPRAGDCVVAVGLGARAAPGRWTLAAAVAVAPPGPWRVTGPVPPLALHGWLMAQHRFTRYRAAEEEPPRTLLVEPGAIGPALAAADAEALVRDLVDTPAEDLGPAELEEAVRQLAHPFDARVESVVGEELLAKGFPAVHAVGRASPRAPRLVALDWGPPQAPLVALVGKGITFDTGGLNLKPGPAMALMKKDMGGAAHAAALARLVMAAGLPVRLKLVIAAADNAVSGHALRPGDVIATRRGLSVEVTNTDAEGRLVLADALALVGEEAPAVILDFATLTGAARVALGPELPALFTNDEALAADLAAAAAQAEDPVWRLPLWAPYRAMLKSRIADLANSPEGPFAGAIAGALFLERFVPPGVPWAHLDLYAWHATERPGRPRGGAAQGLFATFTFLERRFGT
ncbi:MAG: leucyl aminopeptidase family protein [Sphingomonadaceae bacterium]|uniref:leucyl aminopeptidase family protein n=1 Tax=Thermaurantiacus sp. TaxID=2820283 RepID=UPI00298ED559|nr:leucyl aminopeptidase family protein [Thermaurantiacus sp.]MCS6987467.1 leucyl aminopeptidase family protein [Sphingomonadaceae bacterium]MDW8415387.1 leucyl aminopeptidase family protein [Thermaurantiacus sp.]